jgi:hypothetical protein
MKDTNEHSFEEEFKKAFDDAELTPVPALWDRIDAHLANEEALLYKRRLYNFKLRVAAAIALLLVALGVWNFSGNQPADNLVAVQQSAGTEAADSQINAGKTSPEKPEASPLAAITEQNARNSGNAGNLNSNETPANTSLSDGVTAAGDQLPASPAGGNSSPGRVPEPRSTNPRRNSGSPGPVNPSEAIARRSPVRANTNTRGTLPPANDTPAVPEAVPAGEPGLGEIAGITGTETDAFSPSDRPVISAISRSVRIPNEPLALRRKVEQQPLRESIFADELVEETRQKKSGASRWSMGLAFTPNQFEPNMQVSAPSPSPMSYSRSMANNSPSLAHTSNMPAVVMDAMPEHELDRARASGVSYNLGFNVNYALSDRISVQSGLHYLLNNSQINTSNYLEDVHNRERFPAFVTLLENGPVTRSGDFLSDQANLYYAGKQQQEGRYYTMATGVNSEVAVYNSYQYLSVPLALQFKLLDKKVSSSIGAGLAADMFLQNTLGNEAANVSPTSFTSAAGTIYRNVGLSGLMNARVQYSVTSRYGVYVEPSYRMAISSYTRTSTIISRPYAFGVGMGFQYHF